MFQAIADERYRFQANCELTVFSLRKPEHRSGEQKIAVGDGKHSLGKEVNISIFDLVCLTLELTSVSAHIPGENPSIPDNHRRPVMTRDSRWMYMLN